jgi:GDP-L-fucose synthase
MRIALLGHQGMVGRAVARALDHQVVTKERDQLDLVNQVSVKAFFKSERLDAVVLAAAKVGGIGDNIADPVAYAYDNAMITCNVLHAALESRVPRLLFLGSSCMYPAGAPQPMKEELLLTGPYESTNEMYGLAKTLGVKLCEMMTRQYGVDYSSLIPCNLYGPNDRFSTGRGHVIPALLERFHQAKISQKGSVKVWGDGRSIREFMHVDDLAQAIVWALDRPFSWPYLNCGSGREISIRELANLIRRITGFKGDVLFESSAPNGIERKLIDSSRIRAMGWNPSIPLDKGIEATYSWYLQGQKVGR